jgi:hypothetical protein
VHPDDRRGGDLVMSLQKKDRWDHTSWHPTEPAMDAQSGRADPRRDRPRHAADGTRTDITEHPRVRSAPGKPRRGIRSHPANPARDRHPGHVSADAAKAGSVNRAVR